MSALNGKMAIGKIKFWTDYQPGPDGKPAPVDWVEWWPVGRLNKTSTVEKVSRLAKLMPRSLADSNPVVAQAWARWDIIKAAYDAWKAGQDMPLNGTPLAAWPGITSTQAEGLRSIGIRSVEEVADADNNIISRFPFGGGRALAASAKAFLAAYDKQQVANDLAAKDAKIAAMEDQLEEMRRMVIEMNTKQPVDDDEVEAPKRRGRPPKVQAESEAA